MEAGLAVTDKEFVQDTVAMALNGVPIYTGAVGSNAEILDLDDTSAEWTSFDFCGGHARCLAHDQDRGHVQRLGRDHHE